MQELEKAAEAVRHQAESEMQELKKAAQRECDQ